MKNEKIAMTGIRTMARSEIPMPKAAPGEIVVAINHVGICGSDIHFYTEGRIGKKVVEEPLILGHEAAGTIVEVGEGVDGLVVGDRVALEPGRACGHCEYCMGGRYNLCPSVAFMASPPYDGALRNYMAYPASLAFKLPDNISTEEGAMVEPLAVGLHAARRGEVQLGKTVAILGGGPIGIMTVLACRAMSATKVIVSDLFDTRLANALKFGADVAVNPKHTDVEAAVLDATDGQGADVVFETAGSPVTMAQTVKLVKRGGLIVIVGNITKGTSFDFLAITNREVDIRPVFRYRNIYPIAIDAIRTGKIDLKALAPRIFPFDQTQAAFDYTIDNAEEVIKTLIRVTE